MSRGELSIGEMLPAGWHVSLNEAEHKQILIREGHTLGEAVPVDGGWQLLLEDEAAAKGLREQLTALGFATTLLAGAAGCDGIIVQPAVPNANPYVKPEQARNAPVGPGFEVRFRDRDKRPAIAPVPYTGDAPAPLGQRSQSPQTVAQQTPSPSPFPAFWDRVGMSKKVHQQAHTLAKGSVDKAKSAGDISKLLKKSWKPSLFPKSCLLIPIPQNGFGAGPWNVALKQVATTGTFTHNKALRGSDLRYKLLLAAQAYCKAVSSWPPASDSKKDRERVEKLLQQAEHELSALAAYKNPTILNEPPDRVPIHSHPGAGALEPSQQDDDRDLVIEAEVKWSAEVMLRLIQIPKLRASRAKLAGWRKELDASLALLQKATGVDPFYVLGMRSLARAWAGDGPIVLPREASPLERFIVAAATLSTINKASGTLDSKAVAESVKFFETHAEPPQPKGAALSNKPAPTP